LQGVRSLVGGVGENGGHDSDLAGISGLLGLHGTTDGLTDDTPPDSQIVFELWQRDGGTQDVLRIRYRGQTLDQLRTASLLIYPQTPKAEERWKEHDVYLTRLGNLTLLDHRLNETIKNGVFSIKLPYYKESRLLITKSLDAFTEWNPTTIEKRQATFCDLAAKLWPENLGHQSS
jgi:hypothetical protein